MTLIRAFVVGCGLLAALPAYAASSRVGVVQVSMLYRNGLSAYSHTIQGRMSRGSTMRFRRTVNASLAEDCFALAQIVFENPFRYRLDIQYQGTTQGYGNIFVDRIYNCKLTKGQSGY